MKRLFSLILVIGGICHLFFAHGQVDVSEVSSPQAPASTMLGLQPSVVAAPKSYKELEATLLSNFKGGSGLIPNDFALEFTPYWSGNTLVQPIDFMAYNIGESALRNLSLSLASTNDFIVFDSLQTNALSFGVRTVLMKTDKDRELYLTKLQNLSALSSIELKLSRATEKAADEISCPAGDCDWSAYKDSLTIMLTNAPYSFEADVVSKFVSYLNGNRKRFLEEIIKYKAGEQDGLSDLIQSHLDIEANARILQDAYNEKRFNVELALAGLTNFPTSEADFSYLSRLGAWATAHIPLQKSLGIEGAVAVRYIWYNEDFNRSFMANGQGFDTSFDLAGKLTWKRNKFSLDAEFAHRWSQTILSNEVDPETGQFTKVGVNQEDNQVLLDFIYQITDNLILSYTWGEQLQLQAGDTGTLISLLTLTQSFGGPKVDELGSTGGDVLSR